MPSTDFEMEEFVNFTISDTEDQQQPLEPQDWTKYPDLFKEQKENIPASLITFDNASLMEEEYVDPFASLRKPIDSKQELLKKLKSRRQKLEEMAKSLTQLPKNLNQWDLDMDCTGEKIHLPPQVQAYYVQIPDFEHDFGSEQKSLLHILKGSISDDLFKNSFNEKQMATSMLNLFEAHLPEYLFV
jgi:hypothetical protein